MKKLSVLVILAMAASASAAVIEDFESYNIGDPYGQGTIVADPDNANNKVLLLAYVNSAHQYAAIPIPGAPLAGVVGMDVYDYGKTNGAHYGPRWGIGGTARDAAAFIREGSGITSSKGYGMSYDAIYGRTASWFSSKFFGSPRLVDQLFVPGDPLADPPIPDTPADGDWSTWTFTTGGGVGDLCYIDNGTASNQTDFATGALVDVWFWSGRDLALCDVLIDNVTFDVPEPATMSLLALGGLAMLRRRR